MFIGHLPAGYIFGKFLASKLSQLGLTPVYVVAAGMVGGLAPDFDMLYFYAIDHKQHLHHTYWSHYPIAWISLLLVCLGVFTMVRHRFWLVASVFAGAGFLHLLLDSIVGDIWWLAPFVDQSYALFEVTARYHPWWLKFVFHWSFALEVLLVMGALWLRLAGKSPGAPFSSIGK